MNDRSKKALRKTGNFALLALLLALVFVPEMKAVFQQGLMKLGFFKPDLSLNSGLNKIENNPQNSSVAANYRMSVVDELGRVIQVENLKNKVVFINFWATWCGPCIAEMPSIQQLHNQFKDHQEIVFLMVEVDGNQQKARKFMDRKDLKLPLYFPASEIPKPFFTGTLPTTVILDKNGNIAHRTEGMADYSGLEMSRFIQELAAR